jgi:hypothetical protein
LAWFRVQGIVSGMNALSPKRKSVALLVLPPLLFLTAVPIARQFCPVWVYGTANYMTGWLVGFCVAVRMSYR